MKKGTYLKLLVYVEGEDAPAHDFVAGAKQMLQDMCAQSSPGHAGWQVQIKKIEETEMPGEWD